MGKGWSLLFGVVMAACFLLFAISPAFGWWLTPGYSTHAGSVDRLFYIILAVTGFFFVLTEILLVVFRWQYGAKPGVPGHVFAPAAQEEKGAFWTIYFKHIFRPLSAVLHNQHRVEMAWTLVPALILLYIAFAQVSTWAEVKYQSRMSHYMDGRTPVQCAVSARQFEWRVRYPSAARMEEWLNLSDYQKDRDFASFAREDHADDVRGLVNEVHTWKGQPILIQLSTLDVIHSFNIPQMRVKQDALPGKIIPLWFTPTHGNCQQEGEAWVDGYAPETGRRDPSRVWQIACAELCGWGHYRMIGKLYVHETREDFLEWLKQAEKNQNKDSTR